MSVQAGPSRLRQTPLRRHGSNQEEENLSALAARLSIQDIEELQARQRGQRREGAPMSDAELALSLFAEDAHSLLTFNTDRAMALSLSEIDEVPDPVPTRRLPTTTGGVVHSVNGANRAPPINTSVLFIYLSFLDPHHA